MRVPVFINCRDRVSTLVELVNWFERTGHDGIFLLDNDSTYEPLLAYYDASPHTVIRLGLNYGKLAMWKAPGVLDHAGDRSFIYTDPDVLPDPDCPGDAVERFAGLLARYPGVTKVGFGLRIDDLPDAYPHKHAVIAWERAFWEKPLECGTFYAPIDTTIALYRPRASFAFDAIRTGPPYVARHESWYLDFGNLSEEDLFYQERVAQDTEHSPGTSHWGAPELPDWLATAASSAGSSPTSRAKARLKWTLRDRRAVRRRLRAVPSGASAAPKSV